MAKAEPPDQFQEMREVFLNIMNDRQHCIICGAPVPAELQKSTYVLCTGCRAKGTTIRNQAMEQINPNK